MREKNEKTRNVVDKGEMNGRKLNERRRKKYLQGILGLKSRVHIFEVGDSGIQNTYKCSEHEINACVCKLRVYDFK